MNIVMLSEVSAASVIGGAERVLREQSGGLARAGHDVRLVVRQPPGDPRAEVTIQGMVERRYPVARRGEIAFVLSTLRGSLRGYDQARAGLAVDAVLIHQALAGLGPIVRRAGTARAWVYLCHSLAHEEYRSRLHRDAGKARPLHHLLHTGLRRLIERRVMRRCDRVVVLSAFMRDRVQRVHDVAGDRIVMVPGAADLARFHPASDRAEIRRELKLPPDAFLLFTVRNLVPRMGLDHFLAALAALGEDRRGLHVLIGGEGPLRPALERDIRRHGLTDQVRLLGFVPETVLPKYYQAADLVVMPTQELEGFGLVTVEALACGTPVLGTPVGAIPEILLGVDPALVAAGHDRNALTPALRHLIRLFRQHPEERRRLAAKGRALVERRYTWEGQTEALQQLLQTLCRRSSP